MRKSVRVAVGLLAMGVFAAGCCVWAFGSIYNPKPFNAPLFNSIVVGIESGKFKGVGSTVVLPYPLSLASINGRAYISGDWVFIPSWLGGKIRADNDSGWVEGYVYTPEPLEALTAHDPDGPFIDLTVPAWSKPRRGTENQSYSLPMFIDHKIANKWYEVNSFS